MALYFFLGQYFGKDKDFAFFILYSGLGGNFALFQFQFGKTKLPGSYVVVGKDKDFVDEIHPWLQHNTDISGAGYFLDSPYPQCLLANFTTMHILAADNIFNSL